MIDRFRQALLVHTQIIHVQLFDLLLNIVQKVPIHPVLHIADCDIRPGCLSGLRDLHHQMRVTDTAPDQRRIENDRFHKSVAGSPERLILLRFPYAPGGICPAVN